MRKRKRSSRRRRPMSLAEMLRKLERNLAAEQRRAEELVDFVDFEEIDDLEDVDDVEDDDGEWVPWPRPSRPRRVAGGIRAHSQRGRFGKTPWGKRWVEVIEAFPIAGRLARGRSYARSGQTLELAIAGGRIRAAVQGSRRVPYHIEVHLAPFPRAARQRLVNDLARDAALAAQLLAGTLPPELEAVCARHGLSLFPGSLDDLHTQCSCPDWSNPCKHIAGVFYLLAEEIDRDPLLLLSLRGIERDALLGAPVRTRAAKAPAERALRLVADPAKFWGPAGASGAGAVEQQNLLGRLGPFPFWRSARPFVETMRRVYEAAAEWAGRCVAGEAEPRKTPEGSMLSPRGTTSARSAR